jgi:hypothetical protein
MLGHVGVLGQAADRSTLENPIVGTQANALLDDCKAGNRRAIADRGVRLDDRKGSNLNILANDSSWMNNGQWVYGHG